MKKVLIITYYWPPSGGAGVQRWLKFVKYLREFNWEPIVYTPEHPEIPVIDESLNKDVPNDITVLKTPIWEPYDFYKKIIGKDKNEKISAGFLSENKKPKLTEKISVWIRGNFFIPDARKFWINPSVSFLSDYIKKNEIDAIVSTGPPHSMHLIALKLKDKFNIPWVADFRDPWTNIDFYKDLMLTSFADRKHKRLEKKVLTTADAILTIGKTMKDEFVGLGAKNVVVLTNGFDEQDTSSTLGIVKDEKFSLAHIGSFVKSRDPLFLWQVLSELVAEQTGFADDLEIKLVGKVDFSVLENIKKYRLNSYVNKIDYLPHQEVIKEQQRSQVLLLLLNDTPNSKGILTGKFFEYLSAKRPILCIGPMNGDAAEILNETKSGNIVEFEDKINLKKVILDYYRMYKNNGLEINSENLESFSRRNITGELSKLLNSLTN